MQSCHFGRCRKLWENLLLCPARNGAQKVEQRLQCPAMLRAKMFTLSLATKCRVLFGLAVVLIIASALFVPWRLFETLVHERNFQSARALTLLARARLDPANTNWDQQQVALDRWWEDNAKPLRLPTNTPPPKMILLAPVPATAVDQQKLIEQLSVPARLLWRPLALVGKHLRPGPSMQAVIDIWHVASQQMGGRCFARARALAVRAIEMMFGLDDFQRECVRSLRKDDKKNEMRDPTHRASRPTTYRFILGVRGDDAGTGQRPLVGIIDYKFAAPDTDEALLWMRVVIALAGLLAGFLAILVFYLIVQKLILAPVRELTVLAEEVAGGQLSARAAMTTGDEFEELADAFNDMLGRLERSRIELETINRSLDSRLGELAETNVALFESNRLKSEFLANVSHELRTPLTSIIGFADLLRDNAQSEGPIDRSRFTRFAHNILTSGRMLLDLINDLLDLAKIEADRVELHRTRFSLPDICEALRDFMRPLVDKKQLTLIVDLASDLPMMHSDAGKLRQILYNLLSNAVKYTPEGGTIRLEATLCDEGRKVRLVVADTGPGIAPEAQDKIFEKFHQMDASVTREHSGSGLGLAISKELIQFLGGSIHVESDVGRGALFIVELAVECPESVRRPLPSLS